MLNQLLFKITTKTSITEVNLDSGRKQLPKTYCPKVLHLPVQLQRSGIVVAIYPAASLAPAGRNNKPCHRPNLWQGLYAMFRSSGANEDVRVCLLQKYRSSGAGSADRLTRR